MVVRFGRPATAALERHAPMVSALREYQATLHASLDRRSVFLTPLTTNVPRMTMVSGSSEVLLLHVDLDVSVFHTSTARSTVSFLSLLLDVAEGTVTPSSDLD